LRAFRGRSAPASTVKSVNDDERDAAVKAHLDALDDEIARLRRTEAAMDRRLAEAEEERRAIDAGPGGLARDEREPGGSGG